MLENIVLYCGKENVEIKVNNVMTIYQSISATINKADPTLNLSKNSSKEIETFVSSRVN